MWVGILTVFQLLVGAVLAHSPGQALHGDADEVETAPDEDKVHGA